MGERAVALCRDGPRDHQFRSQWGGTFERRRAVLAGGWDAVDRLLSCDWRPEGGQSPTACLETLDYLGVQALYVLTPAAIRVGVPVWLGAPTLRDSKAAPSWVGVLVIPETVAGLSRLTAQVQWLRDLLGRALDDGALTVPGAIRVLLQSLSHSQIHIPDTVGTYLREVEHRTGGV